MTEIDWLPADSAPQVADSSVYCVDFGAIKYELPVFERLLSPEELVRADASLSLDARERAILSRGLMRELLALHVGRPAESLRFDYNPHGKPQLPEVSFNLTHTKTHALLAVTQAGARIGIDAETVCVQKNVLAIAKRFFHPDEYAYIASLPTDARHEAFYTLWTQKEAWLKADGRGLAAGLHQKIHPRPGWTIKAFMPYNNSYACVAVEKPECTFDFIKWKS